MRIHRWLGLALGVWILAMAMTGSLLAFRAPLEAFLDPKVFWFQGRHPGRRGPRAST
jgi:uncharacterized iron-regulated membrane protein